MKKQDDIVKETAEIRAKAGMRNPPFDVFKIAETLGIEVEKKTSLRNFDYSGSITKDHDGKVSIWVNPRDIKARQNFTVAHEIGHYHNKDLKNNDKEFRDNHNTLYRNNESNKNNKKEWEANRFAAELLMPEEMIRKEVDKLLGSREAADFGEFSPILAEKFGVSKAAIRVRLKILGMIKQK